MHLCGFNEKQHHYTLLFTFPLPHITYPWSLEVTLSVFDFFKIPYTPFTMYVNDNYFT